MAGTAVAMVQVASAGALAAAGLSLVCVPGGVQHARVLRGIGLGGILLAVGAWGRAAFLAHGGDDGVASAAFRLHHVAWALGASIGPVLVWWLAPRGAQVPAVAAPVAALLLAVFAWTPAFLPGPGSGDELASLGIRWAFIGTVGVAVLASGWTAVRMFGLLVGPVNRATREMSLAIAFPYLVLTAVSAVISAADAGASRVFDVEPAVASVPIAWAVSLGLVQRLVLTRQERAVHDMRQDMDAQAASSIRDPLTGLFNRGYFAESLRQTIEQLRRTNESFALCLMDLDDFKAINDTHGHPAGDQVLRTMAKVVMRTCRPYDTAARYGGEEFVVILRNVEQAQALMIAERLRSAIASEKVKAGPKDLSVTATFGVVAVSAPPPPIQDVIRRADEALYEGKRRGKNQVRAG